MRKLKESGYGYLGTVPEDWKLERIKNHLRFSPEKNPGGARVLSLYREYGVIPKDSRDDNHNVTSEDTSNYRYVRVGDFVVNKMKAWQGSMAVSEYEGVVSPAYYVYSFTSNEIDRRYLHYLLRSKCYAEEFRRLSAGIRIGQWDLPKSGFESTYLSIPPIIEQQKIADKIAEQKKKVERLIINVQTQIEKLQTYKQNVITEVVTKGLDSSVKFEESGVEWVGSVPSHWKPIQLKYCTYIRARLGWKGLKADEYVEEGFPLLSAFNIQNSKLDFSEVNYISQFRYDESPEIKLSLNDILLVKDGAGIGKCAIVEELPIESTTNGSLAVITITDALVPKYLYYYFLSVYFQKFIDRIKDGMGVPHLFQSDLREIRVIIPSKPEQLSAIEFLDKKCACIDQLIALKQAKIEKLEQYKKSLIYEYVTGKKEVS